MIYTDDGLRLEGVIYHISITYLSLRRKRIRDATLHTFIYHYIFAAKSKFLII